MRIVSKLTGLLLLAALFTASVCSLAQSQAWLGRIVTLRSCSAQSSLEPFEDWVLASNTEVRRGDSAVYSGLDGLETELVQRVSEERIFFESGKSTDRASLIGRCVLRVPLVGAIAEQAATPRVYAIWAGIAFILLLIGSRRAKVRPEREG